MRSDPLPRLLSSRSLPSLAALVALVGTLCVPAVAVSGAEVSAEGPARLARQGSYEEAAEGFRAVLEKEPARVDARRGLAEVLAAKGEYDEALEVLREAEGDEGSAELRAAEGRLLFLDLGRLDEAEKAFRAALDADPSHVEALTRLGETLARKGRRDEAEELWNRVISVYQELTYEEAEKLPAEVFVEMGVALRNLNRYHEANDVMFPQARDQDEKCPSLLLEWGRTYQEKYDFPYARKFFREAFDQNPAFADARVAMAENYLIDFQVGTDRYDLAQKQIERALETNPRHAGAYAARGSLWLSDGDLDRAIEDFEKSLEVNATDPRTLGLLAACYHLSQGEEKFDEVESRALSINPGSAGFYHTIALAIERRFRYADAVTMCEKALELDPDYWPAYHTLGINYLRTGKEELGREYLQKSYDKDPFNIWVVNTRTLLRHIDKNHVDFENERFECRFPKEDARLLTSHLVPLLDEAYEKLPARYGVELEPPIHIDVFSDHQWFSARIVGLGGFPATGACFGNVVALTTPKALPQNWGAVAWHEFAHVVTLAATGNRIPRWLTEGLSVYEEGRDHPQWSRNFSREIADAYGSGRLLGIAELDSGFSKPKYPQQVLISYFQGCLVVQHITEKWGFEKVRRILEGYAEKKTTAEIFRSVLDLSLEEYDEQFFSWLDRWVKETGYTPALAPETVPRLEIAVEERPEDTKLLCDLAWAYLTNGNDTDAPLTAAKALELDPESGDAHAILGFSRLGEKKYASARESLEKALEHGTRFLFRVHEQLGRMAYREKDYEKAAEHLEKAKETSPRAGASHPPGRNVYYLLSDIYKKLGKEEEAMRRLEELRPHAVEDPRCRLELAKHYLVEDTEESAGKALEVLDELIYINPFDRQLHEQLARVAVKLGKHDITVREYEYLLTFPDTNPRVAYLTLARAYGALGKAEKAEEYARKLLRLDPRNDDAREILEELGKG